jgi:DNA mismatch repair protein MutS
MNKLVMRMYLNVSKQVKGIQKYVESSKTLMAHLLPDGLSHFYPSYITTESFPDIYHNPVNIGGILKQLNSLETSKLSYVLHIGGVIDSMMSLCVLRQTKPLSYVNYTNGLFKEGKKKTDCYLVMKNMTHPNLSNVPNTPHSVEVKNGVGNSVITGPNAGGKSTFLRSIAINVYLSQTICMNFSSYTCILPYSFICTQFNVYDRIGSKSLFQSEMTNTLAAIESIVNNQGASLLLMDELFTSTNAVEGLAGAIAICKKLGSLDRCSTFVTTHFQGMHILKNHNFFLRKMNALIGPGGEISFPYKLKNGFSRQYIALNLLAQEGLEHEILEDAISIVKKIS